MNPDDQIFRELCPSCGGARQNVYLTQAHGRAPREVIQTCHYCGGAGTVETRIKQKEETT